jgi:addiction module HigA family antidote
MKNPAHPGEVLRELYLAPLELTVTEAAAALGVTRKTFSQLLNCRAGISTAMALRLSKAFETTPELWLNMQVNYDLWQERQHLALDNVRVLV